MRDTPLAIDPREVKNLRTLIADRLTNSVLAGSLEPGQHLVQTDLAARFGVSRVAVRDALQELCERGLAVNVPLKGTLVRPITERGLRDLFEIRQLLEPTAAEQSVAAMTGGDHDMLNDLLSRQEAAGKAGDMAALLELDWDFHQALYRRSGNAELLEMIARIWSQIRQARGLAQSDPEWGGQWSQASLNHHQEVVSAALERDGERTRQLVDRGIAASVEDLVQGLRASGWIA